MRPASRASIVLTLVAALAACDPPTSTRSTSPTVSAPNAEKPPAGARPTSSKPSRFTAPREERTSAYEVTWSVSIEQKGGAARVLKLEYAVKAFEELYIADRLWDYDANHRRIADPFGIYRFVRDGSLRLVFAQAPHPPNVTLGNYFAPLYSRIRAGETRRASVQIKLPVDEYSALDRDVNAPTVVEEVSRVFFVLGYALRSKLDRDPARATPKGWDAYSAYGHDLIVLELPVDKLPVRRRTGYIARFPLPGEPGPGPIPIEQLR